MLNRRHIRLKIMQYLYALEVSDFEDTKEHYKNLINNIDSSHSLFLFQISLFIEIFKKAIRKFNISRKTISSQFGFTSYTADTNAEFQSSIPILKYFLHFKGVPGSR